MTSGFHSLYYTDCLPGQGLRGGAGFQFQSVSEGTSDEEMTLVQRTALYEAPVPWMREHRPTSDYPPSLTHVVDDVFVTARGVYLGTEANGVREGNQFTHAVVTADPAAYGLIRPAQLWDAPWWSRTVAPTTRCEPVGPLPEPGPLGVDAIREWVLAQSGAEDLLLAVHSAFDQLNGQQHRRVVLVAEDVDAAVTWLAAGTLLLPQARALRISFRVLTTNPNYSRHDVLVLHPDWAGRLAEPRRDGEFLVFNLVTGRHSEIEPTGSALQWVHRFLRDDPYDVIDAIELAHRFALTGSDSTAGHASAADRRASSIVVLGDKVGDGVQADSVASWLHDQPSLPVEDVVEAVVEAVLAEAATTTTLRTLDQASYRHRIGPQLASRVRMALLTSEVDDVVAGRAEPDGPTPPRLHQGGDGPDARGVLEAAADVVVPERMDQLLRAASRFGVQPQPGRFRDGAHRFVRWWADHPTPSIDPSCWPCEPELVDLLRDELGARLSGSAGGSTRKDIRGHWWTLLLPTLQDVAAPLDAAVCAAAVADGASRRETIDWVLDAVTPLASRQRGDAAWDALFAHASPTADELCGLLRVAPELSERVAGLAFAALAGLVRTHVTKADLDALAMLNKARHQPTQTRLREFVGQDARLSDWSKAIANGRRLGGEVLQTVSAAVLAARADLLADTLLSRLDLDSAATVVEQSGEHLPRVLVDLLPRVWEHERSGPRLGAAVALAYMCINDSLLDEQAHARLDDRLSHWVHQAAGVDIASAKRALHALSPETASAWQEATDGIRSQPAPRRSSPRDVPSGTDGKPFRRLFSRRR